ncbi:hypothetical protein Tco_1488903 [Tanacetum coccineum]
MTRSTQNESLAIAGRNLFDAEASSSSNTGAKPPTPPETLHEHSHPNPSEEGWNRIEEYVLYQDDLWDDMTPPMNVSSILEAMQPTGSHEADECKQTNLAEQVCLSGGDIYDDPSLLRFYQNDDTPPRGNNKRKEKGEDGLKWIVRSKFNDELAKFMLEKKSHTKRRGDMLDQHRKELHEQFSQILSMIRKSKTPKTEAPTFSITTRS